MYEFQAGDKQGTCGEGREFLRLLGDGRLQYISRGDFGSTVGNLVRSDLAAKKLPVLYSDDGSPDGTTALLYLLADPRASIQAVTVSYGEAHPEPYTQHLGRMLDGFGLNRIPLGYGQDAPLAGGNPFPEWMRRDANDFWSIQLPHRGDTYPAQPAAELMVSILIVATEPVTVFVSSPCTDLAMALEMDPGIREHIQAVYVMGGAVNVPGNIDDLIPNHPNKTAEWNIFGDSLSAERVFESGLEIYLIPLDATSQVRVNGSDTSAWRGGGQIGATAADFYDMMMAKTNMGDFPIWDVMAAEIMVQPDLCGFERMPLEVIRGEVLNEGQTLWVDDGEPNVNVCLRPQVEQIKELLINTFSIAP